MVASVSRSKEVASSNASLAALPDRAMETSLDGLKFEALNPVTEKVMKAARLWMDEQSNFSRFPRPKMCALNVGQVFKMAGITRYKDEGVRNLMANIKKAGGQLVTMPQKKADFIKALNENFGGQFPAGMMVAGMHVRSATPGSQHVGLIGHVDPDGTVWVYHNNWYRPENEGGHRKEHMVSQKNLSRGFQRQFMATPWIRVERDSTGKIVDFTSLMPQIDDMDPLNAQYRIQLAIPVEMKASPQPRN